MSIPELVISPSGQGNRKPWCPGMTKSDWSVALELLGLENSSTAGWVFHVAQFSSLTTFLCIILAYEDDLFFLLIIIFSLSTQKLVSCPCDCDKLDYLEAKSPTPVPYTAIFSSCKCSTSSQVYWNYIKHVYCIKTYY
jgi:hypothetical protein